MKLVRSFLTIAALLISAASASAQSTCNIFTFNNVPTAGQWQQCLSTKQDLLAYTAVNRAGDVMQGRLATIASTTFRAGLAILPGVAPSAPVDGDIWTTTVGMFVRINGVTVGPLTATGSTIPSVVQGDLLYGSGPGTLAALPKNASASRYLSNSGTSNNPAWAQVDLSNGVTGALPLANLATGTLDRVLGYFGSTTASQAAVPNCTGALTYSTGSHAFGCNASGSVIASGTPVVNQVGQWVSSTSLQGVNLVSLLAAGGGISLTGTTTVTVALANNGSTFRGAPGTPGGTASTGAQVMMGVGATCKITPGFSSRVRFTIFGNIGNTTAGQGGTLAAAYGTGSAPANGGALAGTFFVGNSVAFNSGAGGEPVPFSVSGVGTGLTPGVQVWFDLALNATGGTAAFANLTCHAEEF